MFSLVDSGTYVESDSVPWQNYRTIELAIEWGFEIDQSQYELYVALLRANAVDDDAEVWMWDVAAEALEFLQGITFPGMVWTWREAELVLYPDFNEEDFQLEGIWFVDEISELYGASFDNFYEYITMLGFQTETIDHKRFKVIKKDV